MAIIKIPDGNAFMLRITGQISTDDYIENADFSVVRNLIVNFVRRGRDAQDYEVDENGAVVADCDGTLACGAYGVEMVGTFLGNPWRFFEKGVFAIVDESEDADGPTETVNGVPVYDVTVEVSFAGAGVSAGYVNSVIEAHNKDEEAHPYLQELIENAIEVDDVQVNGESVVNEDKVAEITVPTKTSELENNSNFATQDAVNEVAEDVSELQALYQGLTQTDIVIVAAGDWPLAELEERTVYRVAGDGSYTDYMWNGSEIIPMATYSNPAVYDSTGQNTDGAMTQKAVTDALGEFPRAITLNGQGGDTNATCYLHLMAGRKYRIYLDKTTWVYTSARYTKFSIGKETGGTWTAIYTVNPGSNTESYYDITAEECDDYTISMRGDEGETLKASVMDITKEDAVMSMPETAYQYGDSNVYTANNTSGFRYYVVITDNVGSGKTMKMSGEMPSGCLWDYEGFSTLDSAKSTSSTALEYSAYGNSTEYTFSNASVQYVRMAFKAESGNLSSSDITTILNNLKMYIVTFPESGVESVFLCDDEKILYPRTTADNVSYENSTVKDALDGLNDGRVYVKSYAMADMQFNQPYTHRLRYVVKSSAIPVYASIEGNIPQGFLSDLMSFYSASDALGAQVEHVDGAGYWGATDYKFTAEGAYYICIGWKKEDNSAITAEELATLNAAGLTLSLSNFNASGSSSTDTDIVSLNDRVKTLNYLRSAKQVEYLTSSYTAQTEPLVLLHFSDIHGDGENMQRIMDFYNHYASYIDDVLCTGDIIKNVFGDDFTFWEDAGADSVLNCTGNHEYYNGAATEPYYDDITSLQVYNKFFAPYIANWGVVQPDNAATLGLCYYYKDYSDNNVRLIVLDNMRVDTAMKEWFADVLEDARLEGYHVVAAIHVGSDNNNTFVNPFTSLKYSMSYSGNASIQALSEELLAVAQTFIDNGGIFVGWLCGHRHFDVIANKTNYPEQMTIHVATASCGNAWNIIPKGDNCNRTEGTKLQDCFNVVSIDTYGKRIKIHRVGCDVDRDLRHKGNLCYDYENHTIIYSD